MVRFVNVTTSVSNYEICGDLGIGSASSTVALPNELRDDVLTIVGKDGELSAICSKDGILLRFKKSCISYISECPTTSKPIIREIKKSCH